MRWWHLRQCFVSVVGILLLMGGSFASATAPRVTYEIVPTHARVGDLITYTVMVESDAQGQGEPQDWESLSQGAGDFLVVTSSMTKRSLASGTAGTRWRYQATLMPISVGELWWPTQSVNVKTPETVWTFTLKPIRVIVNPVYEAGKPLKPPKPPYSLVFPWKRVLLLGGVILVLLIVLLGVGFWLWKRRKKAENPTAAEPELPPKEWAKRELQQLEKEKLRESGNDAQYYFRITEILKLFLSKSLHESLEELTTEEVMRVIEPRLEEQLTRRIQQVMVTSDLAKFAKYQPSDAEHEELMRRLEIIIERVTP